jgi:peptide deformylase
MVYPIVKYGDAVLEREAEEVTDFDTPELHTFLEDMFDSNPADKLVLINPRILRVEGKQEGEEGCLSIPGFREQVKRGKRATVHAQNAKGEPFEMTGEDLLARAILHETDHLYGKLYIGHISALKRDLIRRKVRKLVKAGEWE